MYRGIIQEGNWVKEGSYLRGVVKDRGYDRFIQRGRIYRIYHKDLKPGPRPSLLHQSSKQLLSYLSHPNAWWRMTAQKLLILKGDPAVIPELKKMVRDKEGLFDRLFNSTKDFGLKRLHALWTLEGLAGLDADVVKGALQDADPRIRAAAIRVSEPFLKQNHLEIFKALKAMIGEKNPEVMQQLLLTFRSRNEETKPLVQQIVKNFPENDVIQLTAKENLNPSFSRIQELSAQYKLRGGEVATQVMNGFRIFQDNCSACHGMDGKGLPQLAPSLVGSPRVTGDVKQTAKILLHGLTGPVNGKEYNGPMASQAQYTDEELADVLSYIREHLNGSGTVWRGAVRVVREKYRERKKYWTLEELKKDTLP
jgi:mono/diheme cytochrome c family protein